MSSVGDADAPLVYIEHDAALLDNPQLLRSVSASLRIMIDNERLTGELRHSLREVNRSRLRIVQAADEARRRAERDLHDGSQQQLFSVALRLRMASDAARADGQFDFCLRSAYQLMATSTHIDLSVASWKLRTYGA